jgi:hypothetical protein
VAGWVAHLRPDATDAQYHRSNELTSSSNDQELRNQEVINAKQMQSNRRTNDDFPTSSDVIDQQSRITVEDEEGALWYKVPHPQSPSKLMEI